MFTVWLDFGASAFAGEARWLEVGTRPGASTGPFTILSPRQELTPSPNAVYSQKAPWAGLAGVPAGFADGTDNDLLGGLSCVNGQIAKWNGAAWGCAADADSGGDITEVTPGAGLTGGGVSGAVTLSANFGGSGVGTSVARSDHDHFGAAWSGTTSPGLFVEQQADFGVGLFGYASGATLTRGVYGQSTSTSGDGVYGLASATTGVNYGVYGQSYSTDGRGVAGLASASSGSNRGVQGISWSTSGTGVYGGASATTGFNYGVYGESASPWGRGVYGLASAATGTNYGVWGQNTSPAGSGVFGVGTIGVWGESDSGLTQGVYGESDSGQGVHGRSTAGEGVRGEGNIGVLGFASSGSGYAYVGYGDRGIWARGTFAGGTFSHPDQVTFWADVATPTRKIAGTGTVSFVQNHPYERDRVLVYAAPEGDEVAVYTRGSARLVEGVARVKLGPTFAWVANPDLGLTAHLTPRGEAAELWVESVGTDELVVRGPAGANAAFDYLVYGLRIGFEEVPVVQPKRQEAFLPDPAAVAAEYGSHTDLQAFSALDRFRDMRAELGEPGPAELSRARALAAAIDTGRAEVLAAAGEVLVRQRAELEGRRPHRGDDRKQRTPTLEADRSPAPASVVSPPVRLADLPAVGSAMPAAEPEERAAPPAPAVSAAVVLPVSEAVEPGDLLTVDAGHPGELRRADVASDSGIAAIAVGPSGMTGGRLLAPVADGRYARVKVDASLGPIRPGDLLTASPTPGHAMRAPEGKAAGALIGKALERLDSGTGLVRVLVLLR